MKAVVFHGVGDIRIDLRDVLVLSGRLLRSVRQREPE
jgi:hypothetical protein